MTDLILMMLDCFVRSFRTQAAVQAEVIARHQLVVLHRTQKTKRLILRREDRCLCVWLSQLWSGWRSALVIVKPETVIAWHRQGFRRYWRWKTRHGRTRRPGVSKETRDLIKTMSRMNVLWGAPRIHSELLKLGINISTVGKYMVRHRKPPTQTWRTFLRNHLSQLASIDFFTVHTIWFEVLFVFVVLAHDRRPGSSILTSPLIRPQSGPRSRSWKPFLSTPHRNISCEIVIESMDTNSGNKSRV
jgi:putative transposase